MARRNELDCLNLVRKAICGSSNIKIERANCDLNSIRKFLNTARELSDSSKFPDFIFGCGIIEHFAVTGYKESIKGSEFKIEEFKRNKETETFFKEEDKKFLNSSRYPGTFYSVNHENIYSNSTYENFVFSFKRNFNHHLESLQKSKYMNETVIFLIEQEDARLGIYENNMFKGFYLLSEDKILLSYLKEKFPSVNYVIFNSADSVEIIDLSNIDLLLKRAKDGLDIRGGRKREHKLKIYFDF